MDDFRRFEDIYIIIFFIIYYNIYYNNYNYLKCFIILIYTFVYRRHTSGYIKYPCFLCKWDSRAQRKHYSRGIWPERDNLYPGSHNIIQNYLVNPNRILLPPLHIKLEIMIHFIKALDQNGSTMQFLRRKFAKISEAKITAGILNGPQLRE